MPRSLVFALSVGLVPSIVYGDTFEDYVVSQLRCETLPSPLPVLIALADAGRISPDDNRGYDSLSCFVIKGGVEVLGMHFDSVCAHEERDEIRAQRPDLLYRGPGTSPGQTLSFGTSTDFYEVRQWYTFNIGTRLVDRAVKEIDWDPTNVGSTVEVECSSWIVN